MEVNDIIELENIEIKRQAVSNKYAPMTEKELLAKLKNPENRKSLEMQMM